MQHSHMPVNPHTASRPLDGQAPQITLIKEQPKGRSLSDMLPAPKHSAPAGRLEDVEGFEDDEESEVAALGANDGTAMYLGEPREGGALRWGIGAQARHRATRVLRRGACAGARRTGMSGRSLPACAAPCAAWETPVPRRRGAQRRGRGRGHAGVG